MKLQESSIKRGLRGKTIYCIIKPNLNVLQESSIKRGLRVQYTLKMTLYINIVLLQESSIKRGLRDGIEFTSELSHCFMLQESSIKRGLRDMHFTIISLIFYYWWWIQHFYCFHYHNFTQL